MIGQQGLNLSSLYGMALDEGFLSYCTGAIWRRMLWSAYSSGERIFGSLASSPVVSSVPAFRCSSWAVVVILG